MRQQRREETLEFLIRAVLAGRADSSRAIAALWQHVSEWGPRWLMRVVTWPASMSPGERMELGTEACGHLVLQCSSHRVGTLRSPSAWACAVLRRYVQAELRKRPHDVCRRSLCDALVQEELESDTVPGTHLHLADALALLQQEVIAGSRPLFSESIRSQFQCFVNHRLGIADNTANLSKRQRERLYQYRRRGKLAALKAYGSLRAKGLDPQVEAALRALLGDETEEATRPMALVQAGGASMRSVPDAGRQTG